MNGRMVLASRGARRSSLLAIVVATILGTTLVLVSPGADIEHAFGQTTSPSPSPSFAIQIINPGKPAQVAAPGTGATGPGSEVSDKPENLPAGQTGDDRYHLVAWVNAVPPNAVVEFHVQSTASGSVDQNLGTATQVGGPTGDTFEFFWDPPQEDQNYNVRAILFSGTTEVARDQETVTVNNLNPSGQTDIQNEPQSETVEITYPVNHGPVGFFTPTGTSAAATVVDVKFSGGGSIRVFYTVSARGTEPSWKTCGTESVTAAADGVRCTLTGGDQPPSVQAISAIVLDPSGDVPTTPTDETPDSGDAHRAFPYLQTVSSVTITPDSHGATTGSCSAVITATYFDQNGRKVAGVNADVHAKGSERARGSERQRARSRRSKPRRLRPRSQAATRAAFVISEFEIQFVF